MTDFLVAVHHALLVSCFGICAMGVLTTWLTTQARAEFREDAVAAFDAAGWGVDASALQTKTARARVSAQRNGYEPLSILGRTPDFGAAFEVEFIKRRSKRHGLLVIDVGEFQQLVRAVMALVGKRPVRKMEWEHRA